MTTIALAVNATNPDTEDRRAMMFMIGRENDKRTAANVQITQENVRRAALVPPLAPLPLLTLLPSSTSAERKASYETVLNEIMHKAHASYIKQANENVLTDTSFQDLKPLWADATPQKKAAAVAALQ